MNLALLNPHQDPGGAIVVVALAVIVVGLIAFAFLEAWRDVDEERLDRLAEEVAERHRAPLRIRPIPGGRVFDWHRDDPDVA